MTAKSNGMIIRESLIRQFDELADERLIYVCAPAGYGKTVAVRQWLDSNNRARVNISLDENDNNSDYFYERFCFSLCACQPKNKALADIVSHPAFNTVPDEFSLRAIALLRGRKRMALVIDDLHFISNQKVLSFLLIALKRLPETFQIVLISRNELPPGFSDLWLRGSLVKITAEQLRFSQEETMLLYKKRGVAVTPEQADDICRFTDGWAIGINALLLSGGNPPGESLEFLEEFIRLNIWDKWDEDRREFMLRTALVRELEPSLCAVLSGVPDSDALLRELMHNGAFVIQISDGIYRYHHLFHSFLKSTLEERGSEYIYPLLEREGEWHLSRRDFYSAMECFIKCKNHEKMVKCLDMPNSPDRSSFVIEKALPIIRSPEMEAAAGKYPSLYSNMAWAAFLDARRDDMTAYIDQYNSRYMEIMRNNPSHAYVITLVRLMDFRVSIKAIMSEAAALPVMPEAKEGTGSFTMNMPLFHRSTRDFSEFAIGDIEGNVYGHKDIISRLLGSEAKLLMESLIAGLLYEQGHLEKAYIHALEANAEIKNHFTPESKFCAIAILACVLDAMGDGNQADLMLHRFESMVESDRAYYLSRNFNALKVRRKLVDGDIKAAADWLAENEAMQYDSLRCYDMYAVFTACKAYITVGDYDSAIILLKKVIGIVQAYNRQLGTIEANVLLSIAYWKKKRGFQREALLHLESAVSLAREYGYTQLFTNESAELTGMLRRLQKRAEQPGKGDKPTVSFIKLLYMNTIEHQDGELSGMQPEPPVKYTDKQKTVMKLLCEGKSYREIAEIIGIKIPTLRSHLALIYKKLDVTSEVDAIVKIKSLDILNDNN